MRYWSFLVVICLWSNPGIAQNDTSKAKPLYTQYPLPQFSVLLTDSTTWYTKNDLPKRKKTIIMLFSPDCEHCKHETELIKKNIKQFGNTQIVMINTLPFDKMLQFYNDFGLREFKNITVGRDTKFFFGNYFKIHYLPFLAIYDKKYKLLKTFEGTPKWEDLMEYL